MVWVKARGKKLLKLLGAGLLLLALGVAALPLWWPWALRPVAKAYGAQYATYERRGYSRFAVSNLTVKVKTTTVRARSLETLVPSAWIWNWMFDSERNYAAADDWSVIVEKSPRKKPPSSTYTNFQRIDRIVARVQKWVPAATLTSGKVEIQERSAIELPTVQWAGETATGSVIFPKYKHHATLQIDSGRTVRRNIRVISPSLGIESRLVLINEQTALKLEGTTNWETNTIVASVLFSRAGRLPSRAELRSESFAVAAKRLGLEGYTQLHGNCQATWESGRFGIVLRADAQPEAGSTTPPLQIACRAAGDTNQAFIEALQVTSAAFNVQLSEKTAVQFSPPFLRETASLKFAADLDQQQWFAVAGRLDGSLLLHPAAARWPSADFHINGRDFSFKRINISDISVSGGFRWPSLVVQTATAELTNLWKASGQAEVDLASRTVTNGIIEFTGTPPVELLPPVASVSNIAMRAEFQGPFTSLHHSGSVDVARLTYGKLRPASASVKWQGDHLSFTNTQLTLTSRQSHVSGRLSAEMAPPVFRLAVEELALSKADEPSLKLQERFEAEFSKGTNVWTLKVEPVHLVGADGNLLFQTAVQWPERGHATASVEKVEMKLLDDFVQFTAKTEAHIDKLNASAFWDKGPLRFKAALQGAVELEGKHSFAFDVLADNTPESVQVENLEVLSQGQPVIVGRAMLPVSVYPARSNQLFFHNEKPLQIQLTTQTNVVFWSNIASLAGLELQRPEVVALIEGSWRAPKGEVRARVESASYARGEKPLPRAQDIDISLELSREAAHLRRFAFNVEGQPVEITATVPVNPDFWQTRESPPLDWRKASGKFNITEAQVAAFERFLPELVAPEGKVSLAATIAPEMKIEGNVVVTGSRTRPLAALGPMRDINADLRFAGHTLKVETLKGSLGGQTVNANGWIRLPEGRWPTNREIPSFHLQVYGTNVPLVRRPDVIVRSDLNVGISNTTAGSTPIIAGTINLRNGHYLSDLADLVPGKVSGPTRRPPYFSIEVEPLADWRLALDVRGHEFAKVRTPLFRGGVSTTLRLQGTLKEPEALGELQIEDGRILFPFANLKVDHGMISLNSENPYRPQLFITASARRVGYDVKMEVTGPADQPTVQFSSSPPLSPEQIMLMITAGQMPVETARLSTQQRAQRVGMFVGRNVLSEFGIGGGDEERLVITSGEQVTETGGQTYEIEYKLTDDWSVVGEYDRFNDLNVGLKWRVYSK